MKVHVTALELGIATQIEVLESVQDPIRHKDIKAHLISSPIL